CPGYTCCIPSVGPGALYARLPVLRPEHKALRARPSSLARKAPGLALGAKSFVHKVPLPCVQGSKPCNDEARSLARKPRSPKRKPGSLARKAESLAVGAGEPRVQGSGARKPRLRGLHAKPPGGCQDFCVQGPQPCTCSSRPCTQSAQPCIWSVAPCAQGQEPWRHQSPACKRGLQARAQSLKPRALHRSALGHASAPKPPGDMRTSPGQGRNFSRRLARAGSRK